MKLVIIFGPQAVGKMTVGHELEKTTGLKLFHNHMTTELILTFFEYDSSEARRLTRLFRDEIFNTVANSDQPGLIFTGVCNFDDPADWERINEISDIFSSKGAEVCLVELEANLDTRIERNKTEHRLEYKPSKRDVVWSESNLLSSVQNHRHNSRGGEIENLNYVRVNNSDLSPVEVAEMVKDRFNL